MIQKRILLDGIPLDICTLGTAVSQIEAAVDENRRVFLSTPNANFYTMAAKNTAFHASLFASDLSLIDGVPIAALAKMHGVREVERVAGSDLFLALDRHYRHKNKCLRVFFFGGRDGAAEKAHGKYARSKNGVVSVGFHNPGFGSVDALSAPETIDKINKAKPDFLLIALGAAKGQAWIMQNMATLEAPLISHLGAVVDFSAGTVQRAPRLLSTIGLEWLWRIKEDPALWRRYALDARTLSRSLLNVVSTWGLKKRSALNQAEARTPGKLDILVEDPIPRVRLAFSGDLDLEFQKSCAEFRPQLAATLQPMKGAPPIVVDFANVSAFDLYGQCAVIDLLSQGKQRAFHIQLENIPPWVHTLANKNKFYDALSVIAVKNPSVDD